MKNDSDSLVIYKEIIALIDLNDYQGAVNFISKNIKSIEDKSDIALLFIICGFINDKLRDNNSAIENFSKAIFHEEKSDFLVERSRDIALSGRSNSKYKNGDFKGAIDDRRKARRIRAIEAKKIGKLNEIFIDFRIISTDSFVDFDYQIKYKILFFISKLKKRKYDLIQDYKKVINQQKREEIIKKLERLSDLKYSIGDFKASINAMRRAEKYY